MEVFFSRQVIHLIFPKQNISWVWYHRLNQYWISFHLGCHRLFVLWRILRSDERDQPVTSVISWNFPRCTGFHPMEPEVWKPTSVLDGFWDGFGLLANGCSCQRWASWESHPTSPHLKDSPFPGLLGDACQAICHGKWSHTTKCQLPHLFFTKKKA